MTWRVDVGDCVHLMAAMPACSVDAVVCDPPYGLEFMGKEWDRLWNDKPHGEDNHLPRDEDGRSTGLSRWTIERPQYKAGLAAQEWHHRWATEALRVLKPGGHLLAFGGTRTSHRLACAIEDAGFEIRDTIVWLYGSGFPKSLDVGKAIDKQAGAERETVGRYVHPELGPAWSSYPATGKDYEPEATFGRSGDRNITAPATPDAQQWDGWGTALKPAHEPIVVARKPLAGTVAANVLEHGTGGLNVDACRIDPSSEYGRSATNANGRRPAGEGATFATPERDGEYASPLGRWPANVVLDEQAATMLDQQSGELTSGTLSPSNNVQDSTGWAGGSRSDRVKSTFAPNSGGASRFFYTAKASRAERNAGLDGFEEQALAPYNERPSGQLNAHLHGADPPPRRNHHPTVKPVSLMRWLCRLVTPPDGLILDPFTGSGTGGIAAVLEGFNFLGCEQDAGYADIARARVGWWELHGHDALRIVAEQEAAETEREAVRQSGQLELL